MSKTYPRSVGGYAFEFGDESAASRILRRIPKTFTPVVERVCSKDSTELTVEDRELIASRIRHHAQLLPCRCFVVCHGELGGVCNSLCLTLHKERTL